MVPCRHSWKTLFVVWLVWMTGYWGNFAVVARHYRQGAVSHWGSVWATPYGMTPLAFHGIPHGLFHHRRRTCSIHHVIDEWDPSPHCGTVLSRTVHHSRLWSVLSSGDDETKLTSFASSHIPNGRTRTRDQPFQWDELKKIIGEGTLSELCRSVEVDNDYQQHRLQVLAEYKSLPDFILYSKFQQVRQWDPDIHKWYVPAPKPSFHDPPRAKVVLVPNDFPYFVAEGIEHWVLWKRGGDGTIHPGEINQATLSTFSSACNISNRILYWENPPHLKSLPEIDHVHILVQMGAADGSFAQ